MILEKFLNCNFLALERRVIFLLKWPLLGTLGKLLWRNVSTLKVQLSECSVKNLAFYYLDGIFPFEIRYVILLSITIKINAV